MRKYFYTNPEAHGFLMEAKACKKSAESWIGLLQNTSVPLTKKRPQRKLSLKQ